MIGLDVIARRAKQAVAIHDQETRENEVSEDCFVTKRLAMTHIYTR